MTTDRNDPQLKEILPDGQQAAYLVLSGDELARGFVRPVRYEYRHAKCGQTTRMGIAIAETYARDPKFYTGTYCAECRTHFPLVDVMGDPQFMWMDAEPTAVGS